MNGGVVPGRIRGGNSIGNLTLANGLTINDGGNITVEIATANVQGPPSSGLSTEGLPNPTSNSFITITGGTTTISALTMITVDLTGVTIADGNYSYQIMSGAGNQSGLNITNSSQFNFIGYGGAITNPSLTGNAGGAVFVNFTTAVPEPSSILAIASAFIVGWRARRRFRSTTP